MMKQYNYELHILESCNFHARVIATTRKAWFHLRMSRILFAVKHFTGEKYLRMLCKKWHVIDFGECHWLRGKNAREMLR